MPLAACQETSAEVAVGEVACTWAGGFGFHGGGRSRGRWRMKERMAGRCGRMTPEERERFRQRMRETFGVDSTAAES